MIATVIGLSNSNSFLLGDDAQPANVLYFGIGRWTPKPGRR
jgi:hypothetical protein